MKPYNQAKDQSPCLPPRWMRDVGKVDTLMISGRRRESPGRFSRFSPHKATGGEESPVHARVALTHNVISMQVGHVEEPYSWVSPRCHWSPTVPAALCARGPGRGRIHCCYKGRLFRQTTSNSRRGISIHRPAGSGWVGHAPSHMEKVSSSTRPKENKTVQDHFQDSPPAGLAAPPMRSRGLCVPRVKPW